MAPGNFFKYLGAQVGSTSWVEGPSLQLARTVTSLDRLQTCPSKPKQKLWMFFIVLLPQLVYLLLQAKLKKGTLQRVDREMRKFVRTPLHLPRDTPLGYFHAAAKDGGLGVTIMTTHISLLGEDLLSRLPSSGEIF